MIRNAIQWLSWSHVTGYIEVENLIKLTSSKMVKSLMVKTVYGRDLLMEKPRLLH